VTQSVTKKYFYDLVTEIVIEFLVTKN